MKLLYRLIIAVLAMLVLSFATGFYVGQLSVGLDRTDLIDVTHLGDSWKKYLHLPTNKIIDCTDYYQAAMAGNGSPIDILIRDLEESMK